MNLSSFCLKRRVTTMMLALAVLIFGIVSYTRLPLDLMPSFEVPMAVVSTTYTGAGPQEMEKLVTKTVESAIGSVSGISSIISYSQEGSSLVLAEFEFGTSMDFAALDMREKLEQITAFLPSDASKPMVFTMNIDMMPVVQLSISGSDDLAALQDLVENNVQPLIERVDGVSSVTLSGGLTNEIEIRLKTETASGYGVSVPYLSSMLAAENLSLPAGDVTQGNQSLSIRTTGEISSLDELKSLLLPLPAGGVIRLSEIADIQMVTAEQTSVAKVNGVPCLNLSINKQSGSNTVEVSKSVMNQLDKVRDLYPELNISVLMDQADYINLAIRSLANNALTGALLAVLVLFLFLRSIGPTIIIGISIPASIITTFTLFYFAGVSLNMMTLGGLCLGVGMMVDNSIVVLENIYRLRLEGQSPFGAALHGASEVAMAITASTITTVAVFVPIVFVEGITSTLFKELALGIAMSLLASLLIALTVVPVLARYGMPSDTKLLKMIRRSEKPSRLHTTYQKLLGASMRHRLACVLIATAIFLGTMASALTLGSEFFPSTDQGMISITASMPEGTSVSEMDEMVDRISNRLDGIPEVVNLFAYSGGMMSTGGTTLSMILELPSMTERERGVQDIGAEVRSRLTDIAGAEITVDTDGTASMSSMLGDPISISIKGEELDELSRISAEIKELIQTVPGVVEASASQEEGFPEVQITVNRQNASRFGLTAGAIAQSVSAAVNGSTSTRLKFSGTEIDVKVMGEDITDKGVAGLSDIMIQTPSGTSVPLDLVADIAVTTGPSTIIRDNQSRTVSVTGQIVGRDVGTVNKEIEALLADYNVPDGYFVSAGGQNEELNEAFSTLALALIMAVLLVFIVLACQFESLILPFSIILAVPLGMSGAFMGLFLTRNAFSVPAFIGLIMLAGIVVNNAIVLVDYIQTLRKEGEERTAAILAAGPTRLRPVLMTTLTTVLGLFPMALGLSEGSDLMAPMAISMIGGLILSTLLTLVVVPVFYSYFDDMGSFFRRILDRDQRGKQKQEPKPTEPTEVTPV